MRVAGVDYSTYTVDVVTVPLDGNGPPGWRHFDLGRIKGETSFDRTRRVRQVIPAPTTSFWDDVVLVVLEEPRGLKRVSSPLFRVQGALLQRVPLGVDCWQLTATEWRRELGLFAGSERVRQKAEARNFSYSRNFTLLAGASEDACEAHCMALAALRMLNRGQAAA